MPERVLMIALSPTMETGTLARWHKKEGETVASGDVLCEVETDKATMDYESTAEGTLLKIVLPEGGQAKVGDTIAVVGKPGEDISSFLAGAQSAVTPAAAARTPPLPGSAQPASGAHRLPAAAAAGGRQRSSPLARRIARERGIELRLVRGTGPGGRVIVRDVEEGAAGPAGFPARQAAEKAAYPSYTPAEGDEVVPVSRMRRIIAQRLAESLYSAPHYYLTVAIGMDALLDARARLNAPREKKVSLNAFLLAFAGRALARHPQVNSTWNGDTMIRHPKADIGLAVSLPDGLVTPVVRDCGRKAIPAIDAELSDLVQRARDGKLLPEEYAGATFTISSLGSAGIDEFTAIINPPGSAILAVGAIRKEPVVDERDAVVVRQRMRATLSCDHRAVDGAIGAAFLRELADMLENPLFALA